MAEQRKQIRITATDNNLSIVIDGWPADFTLDTTSAATPANERLAMDVLRLTPSERAREFVMTFEFDAAHRADGTRRTLGRLEAHLCNIAVRLRDDGYVLTGELTGWVGYTGAAARYVGTTGM